MLTPLHAPQAYIWASTPLTLNHELKSPSTSKSTVQALLEENLAMLGSDDFRRDQGCRAISGLL